LDHKTDSRAANFISLVACPRVALPLRFDREIEEDFRGAVSVYFFPVARGLEETIRTGSTFYIEAQAHSRPNTRRHHSWVILQGGAVGYTCNLVSPTPTGDLATAFLCFSRLGDHIWSSRDYFGSLVFRIAIECPNVNFTPRFPATFDRDGEYDEVRGIAFPADKSPYNQSAASITRDLDFSDLHSEEQVTDHLLYLLRQTKGARVSFPKLQEEVKRVSQRLDVHWQKRLMSRA